MVFKQVFICVAFILMMNATVSTFAQDTTQQSTAFDTVALRKTIYNSFDVKVGRLAFIEVYNGENCVKCSVLSGLLMDNLVKDSNAYVGYYMPCMRPKDFTIALKDAPTADGYAPLYQTKNALVACNLPVDTQVIIIHTDGSVESYTFESLTNRLVDLGMVKNVAKP